MMNILNNKYVLLPLTLLFGLSIGIFFDYLDGGISFTLR